MTDLHVATDKPTVALQEVLLAPMQLQTVSSSASISPVGGDELIAEGGFSYNPLSPSESSTSTAVSSAQHSKSASAPTLAPHHSHHLYTLRQVLQGISFHMLTCISQP